jgi:para-nitrobenzyl esterase
VLALMAMPSAKGLFHRAISQSGPYLRALSPDYSELVARLVLKELGLTTSQVGELQKISVDRLEGAGVEAMRKIPSPSGTALRRIFGESGWGPTGDGRLLPQHPFYPDSPVVSASVPLITGSNLHEFVNGVDHPDADAMSETDLLWSVWRGLGGDSRAIIDAYRSEYPDANPFRLYATIAASAARHPAFEQARRKAALHAAPAYSYIYSWRTPALDDRPGPFHAAELAFVFDNGEICDHYSTLSPEGLALSRQIGSAWVSFARTGDPNHPGMPHWPSYTEERRAVMDFNTVSKVRYDPEGKGLRLIGQPG